MGLWYKWGVASSWGFLMCSPRFSGLGVPILPHRLTIEHMPSLGFLNPREKECVKRWLVRQGQG